MPKGSRKPKKKREDAAQAAVRVMNAMAVHSEEEPEITAEMRAAAAAFGRMGGKIGGPKRAAKLTKAEMVAIAKKGAAARWKPGRIK